MTGPGCAMLDLQMVVAPGYKTVAVPGIDSMPAITAARHRLGLTLPDNSAGSDAMDSNVP